MISARRRIAIVIAVVLVAAAAFAAGAYTGGKDPAAGTTAFMREVARRMDLTPAQLRTTVERRGPRRHGPVQEDFRRRGLG